MTPTSLVSSSAPSPMLSIDSDLSPATSTASSTLTPLIGGVQLGRRRGRPRKLLEQPTFDDYPTDATEKEQEAWVKRKNTEMWRYKKLNSSQAAEFRKSESERVKQYYSQTKGKKKTKINSGEELGIDVLTSDEDPKSREKDLSRIRCVFYVFCVRIYYVIFYLFHMKISSDFFFHFYYFSSVGQTTRSAGLGVRGGRGGRGGRGKAIRG